MCSQYNMPNDVSTAVLIDEQGTHSHSTAILRVFLPLGVFYRYLAHVAMWIIPCLVRDTAYVIFARNRGRIWKGVKTFTGIGDIHLEQYRDRIFGLIEPIDPTWGFDQNYTTTTGK